MHLPLCAVLCNAFACVEPRTKWLVCSSMTWTLASAAWRVPPSSQPKSQLVNSMLRNIASDPTNAQLPGLYNREGIDHLPRITMGCDLPTLYMPCSQNGLKSFDADTCPGLEHSTALPSKVANY